MLTDVRPHVIAGRGVKCIRQALQYPLPVLIAEGYFFGTAAFALQPGRDPTEHPPEHFDVLNQYPLFPVSVSLGIISRRLSCARLDTAGLTIF